MNLALDECGAIIFDQEQKIIVITCLTEMNGLYWHVYIALPCIRFNSPYSAQGLIFRFNSLKLIGNDVSLA